MNASRTHSDGEHHEGDTPPAVQIDMDQTPRYLVTEHGLVPLPDCYANVRPAPAETHQTFANKLREIGYKEPVARARVTDDEEAESMRRYLRARDAYLREMMEAERKIPWRKVLLWLAVAVVVIAAVTVMVMR